MDRIAGFVLATMLAGGLAHATPALGQADSAAKDPADAAVKPAVAGPAPADSGAPAAPDAGWWTKLKLSGYVTASYTYSSASQAGTIVGRFYDRFHDQIAFNAAKLALEKAVATDKWDAGARVDLLFGQNAKVTQSIGLDLGNNGDVTQAFATVNIPTGAGTYVQFKAGKMATLMGVEVIEDVVNPNLSVANQFIYLENFTNTGLRLDAKVSPVVDFEVAVINGWDVVTDNNSRKSFMGRVGIAPTAATVIGLLGYVGPEQAASTSNRYGGEVVLTQKVGPKGTLYLQGDYGEEKDLPTPGSKVKWWGVGLWGSFDATPKVNVAVRGDYIDDKNGARTSGVFGFPVNAGQKFGSVTGTLNIKVWDGALVRPEIRYDRSNLAVFDDPTTPKKDQVSIALGVSYLF